MALSEVKTGGIMKHHQAIQQLQRVASYFITQERTAAISRAEYIISDAIVEIWNNPATDRRAYWSEVK